MGLLIDTPSSFANLVEKELKKAPMLVFIELIDRLERKFQQIDSRNIAGYNEEWHKAHPRHNYLFDPHGCGCELCSMFKEYSLTRINVHRLGRYLERYCSIYPLVALQDKYKTEKEMLSKVKALRLRKQEILKELGLKKYSKAYIPIETT